MKTVFDKDGVTVCSDLSVRRTTDTLVEFSDGSTCNFETGEVHNVGSGTIFLEGCKSSQKSASSKGSGNAIAEGNGGVAIVIGGSHKGNLNL